MFNFIGDLVAGIEQNLILRVSSGSSSFTKEYTVNLKASRGLKLKVRNLQFSLENYTIY